MDLLRWIEARLDAWLTPGILRGNARRVSQARLALLMGLTTAVWGPVFSVVYLWLGMPSSAAVVAACTIYLATAPLILRWTESLELAGHQTASAMWLVIVALSLLSGGIHSSAPPWLVACSFLGLSLGGWRPALVWLGISLLTIVGLAAVDLWGVPIPQAPAGTIVYLRATSLVGAALFVFSLVVVFQVEHDAMGRHLRAQVVALSEANRAKSLFLANMSHELRTPMNAILGYTELVDEELRDRDQPDLADDLGRVRTAGHHLLALIDDLLDLSRIEVGAMEMDVADHPMDDVCREVLQAIDPFARTQGTEVVAELVPAMVRCDRVRAAQIVTNLVHNAVKFDAGGRVVVRCAVEASWVVVEVTDSGPGLSEEHLERVFEEFQQAHPAIRSTHGGTGLGLTISRRLARAMGGDVMGRSTLGHGCCFRVTLPVA